MKRFLSVLIIVLALLVIIVTGGKTEGIRESEAPLDYTVFDIKRVDIVELSKDPVLAIVKIPFLESENYTALITDGYHIVYAYLCIKGNEELFCLFHADELRKLDGTVGVYLVWFSEMKAGSSKLIDTEYTIVV